VSPHPPVVTDQGACPGACSRLRTLSCEEGNPIDMGHACADGGCPTAGEDCTAGRCTASCERFCVETEGAGVWLDPPCVSGIVSCDQVERCPAPQPRRPVDTCTGPACP